MTDTMKQALRQLQQAIINEHPQCEYAEVHFEKGGATITLREKEFVSLREEAAR